MRDQRPERFDFWDRLISAFVMLERDEEALEIADEARRLIEPKQWEWPEAADLHHTIAVALARQGKTQEAESHWRAALKIRPRFSFATDNLDDLRRPVAEDRRIGRHQHRAAAKVFDAQPQLRKRFLMLQSPRSLIGRQIEPRRSAIMAGL